MLDPTLVHQARTNPTPVQEAVSRALFGLWRDQYQRNEAVPDGTTVWQDFMEDALVALAAVTTHLVNTYTETDVQPWVIRELGGVSGLPVHALRQPGAASTVCERPVQWPLDEGGEDFATVTAIYAEDVTCTACLAIILTYEQTRDNAAAYGSPPCTICSTSLFYYPTRGAPKEPGHIATAAGMAEAQISRCCEHCFDRVFKDDSEGPE